MGKIYAKQDSGTYDLNLAIKYLQQSADSDNIYAQAALGSIYLWGRHGVKDVELGKMWLQKSADSGNENALSQIELYNKIQRKILFIAVSNISFLNKVCFNFLFLIQAKIT